MPTRTILGSKTERCRRARALGHQNSARTSNHSPSFPHQCRQPIRHFRTTEGQLDDLLANRARCQPGRGPDLAPRGCVTGRALGELASIGHLVVRADWKASLWPAAERFGCNAIAAGVGAKKWGPLDPAPRVHRATSLISLGTTRRRGQRTSAQTRNRFAIC